MIGQAQLLQDIHNLIDNSHFPRFVVLWGAKGSGKKCMCNEIANMLGCNTVICPDVKVDTIRDIIQNAYKIKVKTLFIIPDSDSMSLASRNALLKVTEEPPNNAYFIMTLEDLNNTLPTIRSRAVTFQMQPYTCENLLEYCNASSLSTQEQSIIKNLCETPGDINYLRSIGIQDFYNFVSKVLDNIAVVSGSNAFKISLSIALKDTDSGYDLKMFLKAFKTICWERYTQGEGEFYLSGIKITNATLQKCANKSINRQMLFDTWLLDIRKEWMQWM